MGSDRIGSADWKKGSLSFLSHTLRMEGEEEEEENEDEVNKLDYLIIRKFYFSLFIL